MSHFAILGSRGYPSYYGGFETLVRRLAPYLAAQGHSVTVYGRDRASGHTVVRNEITVRNTMGIESKSVSTLSHGLTATLDLVRRQCDAALVLNVANGFYLPLLKRAGIATCVNVDGLEWMRGKWGRAGRTVFRQGAALTARHADELIFDSQALRPIWHSELGRADGHFIPYGGSRIVADDGTELAKVNVAPGDYVLVVARVAPENNIDLLLDAVDLLRERPSVVVVGDGNYRQPTVERLRSLAADGVIRWLGHVSDQSLLHQLWAHSAVYWHGHSVGGTNPALIQALAAGAPTLAFDSPFNREVLGRPDQLVPANAPALAARLTELLESVTLRQVLREAGIETVASRYSWESVCRRYCDVLEGLAGRSRVPADGSRGATLVVPAKRPS